ncbi:DUF916 and DUF3324 domain-containing protein [Lactiplantibacillus fabifermentans]|nr:DUF916 and DUF3324 domain-containing protein [Lactiplantibacillus fabifermentans]
MKLFRTIVVVVAIVSALWGIVDTGSASTTESPIGFSVAANIPENQRNKNESYFNLNMNSNTSQDLKATIFNVTNHEIKVEMAIHTAHTNENGVIEYVHPLKKADASLKYRMNNITQINGSKIVTVPAQGKKQVIATVQIPKTKFEGVIQGGWFFQKVDDKVTGGVEGTLNVKSKYSYVIGLSYTLGKVPEPNLMLDSVEPGLENYHQSIFSNLRNTAAVMIPHIYTDTTITNKNTGKVIEREKKENVQMAPNSGYHYPISTHDKDLQAGNYHLHMVAKNNQHQWIFDRDFTITRKMAKKYNRAAVINHRVNIWWFVLSGALGMLLLCIIGSYIYIKIRRRSQKM